MARKIKNLSVKTREYKDRDGNPKANWQNIGVIMENDQGKQFILLEKWINYAGLPDFSGKENSSSLMINITLCLIVIFFIFLQIFIRTFWLTFFNLN